MKIPLENSVIEIAKKLKAGGFRCYIAGGWCRDHFFGRECSDIDLFTDALPEDVKTLLHVVGEVGKKYGTCIITEDNRAYEITTFRKDIGTINNRLPAEVTFTKSLEEDAQRRDFTCNAIYYDILEETFIDPTGGIKDIENNIIRFVGVPEERLEEDILRLLRYVRIKNKYSLNAFSPEYHTLLQKKLPLLENISFERIKDELDLIFSSPTNTIALQELKDIGFFELLFPEIEALEKTPGGAPWHLEGNVWVHSLLTIQELNRISPPSEAVDLVWTMLCHDIGKAVTVTYEDSGRIHYYGHERIGADMFKALAHRWKFSNASIKLIFWLIDNHLRVGMTLKMAPVKRHTFMMHPFFPQLLKVYEADKRGRVPVSFEGVEKTKKYYLAFQDILKNTRFFTGEDVMQKHPHISGKEIGETLEQWNHEILGNIVIDIDSL